MIELVRFFYRLARLQRAPQDLPASPLLLALVVVANVAIGTFGGSQYFGSPWHALLANLVDVTVVAAMVWLLLSVNSHQPRLMQTVTALFGIGALYGLVVTIVQGLTMGIAGGASVGSLLILVLLVWAHVAMGHVLRHALDQSLPAGIALAIGVSAVSFVVVGNLFPVPGAG